MIYEKWDIVLVPFPFTNLSSIKKRPAIIISNHAYNTFGDSIIVYVTSQITQATKPGDYLIKSWNSAGLPKSSLIRMKFATIDNNIILKKLGSLSEIDRNDFLAVLVDFLKA